MKNRNLWLALIILILAVLMVACAPAATPEVEETEEAATEEAATDEPVATEDTLVTDEPTEEVAPVTITVWHDDSGTEEEVMSDLLASFAEAHPEITVEVLAVPPDEIVNKYQTEAATGGGPTVIIGAQDRMAGYAAADLLAEIPADAPFWADVVPAAVGGGQVAGVQVGVPVNNKVLALYYNKSMVETPPATFEELLTSAEENGLALTADWFHNYMFVPAAGASLFDENNSCALDDTGGAASFELLASVCSSAGVQCEGNDGDADTLFRQGEVAYRIQGPWISGDAIADLGAENVGVVRIPAFESGDPRPWNQSDVASVNVNATPEEQAAAWALIAHMVSADVQADYLNRANWIPVNPAVDTSTNPVVGGFLEQVPFSDPFPVVSELGATWEPLGNAVNQVLEGTVDAETAVADACTLIDTANGK